MSVESGVPRTWLAAFVTSWLVVHSFFLYIYKQNARHTLETKYAAYPVVWNVSIRLRTKKGEERGNNGIAAGIFFSE